MRHKQLIFRSCIQGRDLYGQLWLPDGKPLFLLQLVHGVNEYSDCYAEFADWLCRRGVALACHDHLPNGHSAEMNGLDQGSLPQGYGWPQLCRDTAGFSRQLSLYCPQAPLLLLGHSLGAAAVRCLLGGNGAAPGPETAAAPDYRAAVLCSPVHLQPLWGRLGRLLCRTEQLRLGPEGRCTKLQNMVLNRADRSYRAKGAEGEDMAWLSHDRQWRQAYLEDPWRNFTPSLAYCDMVLEGLRAASGRGGLSRVRRELPILLAAGSGDPLGRMGKGPHRLYQTLRRCGLDRTELHIYHGLRHELLQESQRQDVWLQLWKWMADKI